jgi:hypothetical protein
MYIIAKYSLQCPGMQDDNGHKLFHRLFQIVVHYYMVIRWSLADLSGLCTVCSSLCLMLQAAGCNRCTVPSLNQFNT